MILNNHCTPKQDTPINQEIAEVKEIKPELHFGIPKDSFSIVESKIKRNQFLADILRDAGVSDQMCHQLLFLDKNILDTRKIRVGERHTTFLTKDSIPSCAYWVYQPNAVDYIVLDFTGDSLIAHAHQKPVKEEEKSVSGVVESSLYETLQANNINSNLAVHLQDIFAWTVDFYRIHKGDRFKIIYTEKFVDGESIGIGDVKAALFKQGEKDFFAFNYPYEGKNDYFDEEGNSLRKQFLKNPINYTRISSRFSYRRYHPVQKRYKPHLGVDYAAPRGTPIKAVGDGVVIAASYTSGNGRYVKIRHNSVYTTQYLHMSGFARGMRKGKQVKQGDVIGYVGSTGLASGPHLCFRFWKNGRQVNPFSVELPPIEPIADEFKDQYIAYKDSVLEKLNDISFPAELNYASIGQ